MSIRPVLRAVTRSSAESIDLRGLEEQTRRARVSGRYRIAAVSLKGLRFMQGDEFPANLILGNSEALGRRKGPRSNSLGPLLYLPRRARTINSAGLPSNGRRGESSDYGQLPFASPPSSRTDRRILTKQIASCCKTGQRGVSLEAAPSPVPSGTLCPCG